MNAISFNQIEERYRNIARAACVLFAVLFFYLLFYNFFSYPDPPPGQSGTLISFGEPNVGQGSELAAATTTEIEPEPVEETEPEPEVSEPEVEPEPKEVQETKPDPAVAERKKLLEAQASKERALKEQKRRAEKKKRDAENAKKQAERLEAKKKADAAAKKKAAEAEAKRKAAEAAAAKKAAELAEKNRIGGIFGSGSGQGNTGTPGNQGDPNGDPNSKNLEGLGTGKVGGGLSNRGGDGPKLNDRSQKNGKVIVEVCVDSNGKVTKAKATQRGSTLWDSSLNRKIEANAKKWQFKKGELDKQCGTITYTFKLQ